MNKATRIFVSSIGFISGLLGIEHGIGEFLQGNIKPDDLLIHAWPNTPAFNIIGSEPAMTIIPNMRITGAVAIIISSFVAIWAIAFIQKKFGGPVLILFSIIQLLVGGGIAPIVQLIAVGFAALAINSRYTWVRKIISEKVLFIAERGWIWIFIITVLLCLSLFPGSIIIAQLFPAIEPSIIVSVSNIYLLCLLLAIIFSFGHDASAIERSERLK
jgi:hypothetical protein